MSVNQNKVNKGNQKGGAQDQRRNQNEKRDPKNSEQSRNDKKHLQQSQRQPESSSALQSFRREIRRRNKRELADDTGSSGPLPAQGDT